LKPNVGAADPNELKPNVSDDNNGQALPPPQQVNEIQTGAPAQPATATASPTAAGAAKTADSSASSATDQSDDSDTTASSKHKKKKGIHKVVPF
jgi:hypothetical protein